MQKALHQLPMSHSLAKKGQLSPLEAPFQLCGLKLQHQQVSTPTEIAGAWCHLILQQCSVWTQTADSQHPIGVISGKTAKQTRMPIAAHHVNSSKMYQEPLGSARTRQILTSLPGMAVSAGIYGCCCWHLQLYMDKSRGPCLPFLHVRGTPFYETTRGDQAM